MIAQILQYAAAGALAMCSAMQVVLARESAIARKIDIAAMQMFVAWFAMSVAFLVAPS